MERKELKNTAREMVKRQYAILLIACLIAATLGMEFTNSLGFLKVKTDYPAVESNAVNINSSEIKTSIGNGEDLYSVLLSIYQRNNTESDPTNQSENTIMGQSRGVLASIVNGISSGKFMTTLIVGINSITKSKDGTIIVFISLSIIFSFIFWLFVKKNYLIAMRRILLESQYYDKTSFSRFTYLFRNKRWWYSAKVMLTASVLKFLWNLTVIGGCIKKYSYFMVPYIVAENPYVKPKEAINLSIKMMDGHKWQCFVNELTFLGWNLLGVLTFGLTDLFFSNMYKASFFCKYYVELRRIAFENKVEGIEALNDTYLYEYATTEQLSESYAEITELKDMDTMDPITQSRGLKHFLADNFSISLYTAKEEEEYDEKIVQRQQILTYENIVAQKSYPIRLHPHPDRQKKQRIEVLNYLRHYSIPSIILMFFIFSFVGWFWEVSLHLLQDGVFVKRGVLHGPWLPIYGAGGIVILTLLTKLRKKPFVQFVFAVILSGIVEYFTSWYLEMAHNGTKWWDYSGYFINLNGRVCAEGLLVFGLGGIAVVYYVAPLLDQIIRKIKPQYYIALCAILLTMFIVDNIYSSQNPNTGKGITDYAILPCVISENRKA